MRSELPNYDDASVGTIDGLSRAGWVLGDQNENGEISFTNRKGKP